MFCSTDFLCLFLYDVSSEQLTLDVGGVVKAYLYRVLPGSRIMGTVGNLSNCYQAGGGGQQQAQREPLARGQGGVADEGQSGFTEGDLDRLTHIRGQLQRDGLT